MSFAEMVLKRSSTPIHYVWGVNGLGEYCYWFVCCSAAKYDEMEKQFGKPGFKVEEYGVVVAKGDGKVPPEDVKQMLIKEYKVNWKDYEDAMK